MHIGLAALAGIAAITAAPNSNVVDVPSRSIRTATAACKAGQVAVSSGFETPGPGLGNDSGVARIGVLKGRTRVTTRAYNFGEDAGALVSHVYCRKGAVPPAWRVARTKVAPKRAKSVVAVCPRGARVISGGFATGRFNQAKGPQVLALASKRVGKRRWKVQAFNMPNDDPTSPGPERPGQLSAHAYCVRDNAPLKKVAKRVKVPPMPFKGAARPRTFRVSCPGRSRAVAGGFDGNLALRGEQGAAAALTSMRTRDGRGWRTSAISITDRASSKITAYVYCR
jgi:hypothetical protein